MTPVVPSSAMASSPNPPTVKLDRAIHGSDESGVGNADRDYIAIGSVDRGADVARALYEFGNFRGDELVWMVHVAYGESSWKRNVVRRNTSKDYSFGWFGFNMRGAMGPSRRAKLSAILGRPIHNIDLLDPEVAVAGARMLWDDGAKYRSKPSTVGPPGLYHWGGYKDLDRRPTGTALTRARKAVDEFMEEKAMAERKYLSGYGNNQRMRTWAELMAWPSMQLIHPEVLRRTKAMMDAAYDAGKALGPGGAGRTTTQQDRLYQDRYDPVPGDSPPCESGRGQYLGKCWAHVKGAAAAIPGLSYHEPTEPNAAAPEPAKAWALSLDMVGDMTWMGKNLKRFGLYTFSAEPWHTQPKEVPNARQSYRANLHKLGVFALPTPIQPTPTPPPTPPPAPPSIPVPVAKLKLGSKGTDVYLAQTILRSACGQGLVMPTGTFDAATEVGVRNVQMFFKITVDGWIGDETWPYLHMAACNPPQQTP